MGFRTVLGHFIATYRRSDAERIASMYGLGEVIDPVSSSWTESDSAIPPVMVQLAILVESIDNPESQYVKRTTKWVKSRANMPVRTFPVPGSLTYRIWHCIPADGSWIAYDDIVERIGNVKGRVSKVINHLATQGRIERDGRGPAVKVRRINIEK